MLALTTEVSRPVVVGQCNNAAQIWKRVSAGQKPDVLSRIQDRQTRLLVELCLERQELRLSARELLLPSRSFGSNEAIQGRDNLIILVDSKVAKGSDKEKEREKEREKEKQERRERNERELLKEQQQREQRDLPQQQHATQSANSNSSSPNQSPSASSSHFPRPASITQLHRVPSTGNTGSSQQQSQPHQHQQSQQSPPPPLQATNATPSSSPPASMTHAQLTHSASHPNLNSQLKGLPLPHGPPNAGAPGPPNTMRGDGSGSKAGSISGHRGAAPSIHVPSSSSNLSSSSSSQHQRASSPSGTSMPPPSSSSTSVPSPSGAAPSPSGAPSSEPSLVSSIAVDIESTHHHVADIVLHLHFESRKKKQIKFRFDFRNDTSTSIATEMCKALRLAQPDRVSSLIAHTIEARVEPYRKAYYDQMRGNEPTQVPPLSSQHHAAIPHSVSMQSVPHVHQRHSLPAEHYIPPPTGMSHSTSHGHLHHQHSASSSSPMAAHSLYPVNTNGMVPGTSTVGKRSTGPGSAHSATLYSYGNHHAPPPGSSAAHGMPGPPASHTRQLSLPSPHPGGTHIAGHPHPQPPPAGTSRGSTPHTSGHHVKIMPGASGPTSSQTPAAGHPHLVKAGSASNVLAAPSAHHGAPSAASTPSSSQNALSSGLATPPMLRKSSQPLPGSSHPSVPQTPQSTGAHQPHPQLSERPHSQSGPRHPQPLNTLHHSPLPSPASSPAGSTGSGDEDGHASYIPSHHSHHSHVSVASPPSHTASPSTPSSAQPSPMHHGHLHQHHPPSLAPLHDGITSIREEKEEDFSSSDSSSSNGEHACHCPLRTLITTATVTATVTATATASSSIRLHSPHHLRSRITHSLHLLCLRPPSFPTRTLTPPIPLRPSPSATEQDQHTALYNKYKQWSGPRAEGPHQVAVALVACSGPSRHRVHAQVSDGEEGAHRAAHPPHTAPGVTPAAPPPSPSASPSPRWGDAGASSGAARRRPPRGEAARRSRSRGRCWRRRRRVE